MSFDSKIEYFHCLTAYYAACFALIKAAKPKTKVKGHKIMFQIETEQETDGRWIAEIEELSGAMVYGHSKQEAIRKVEALALRILADRLEHGEIPEQVNLLFAA